jgi:hypothetical protein
LAVQVQSSAIGLLGFPFIFDPGFFAKVERIPLLGQSWTTTAKNAERCDRTTVHAFQGTYGDYLLNKEQSRKSLPELKQAMMQHTPDAARSLAGSQRLQSLLRLAFDVPNLWLTIVVPFGIGIPDKENTSCGNTSLEETKGDAAQFCRRQMVSPTLGRLTHPSAPQLD